MPVPPPSLNSEQLVELLALLKKVDTVELKLTVPADAGRRIMDSLGIDPLEAQIRQVVFFDTPDLTLDKARGRGASAALAGRRRRRHCQASAH